MRKSSSVFALVFVFFAIIFLGRITATPSIAENTTSRSYEEKGLFLKESVFSESRENVVANVSVPSKNVQKNSGSVTSTSTTNISQTNSFLDAFSSPYVVEEVSPMSASSNSSWWVNSGGRLIASSTQGHTIQGSLGLKDFWYIAYLSANPLDTDGGLHPQNIFRLVQRGLWQDFREEAYFKINKINMSVSPNRNASNGLFLFNRYQNGDNLYYTGIRVDGAVVIKKKINGTYYTMATKQFISGTTPYNATTKPNLLPLNTWIGLRSEVKTNTDGTVTITFYVDMRKTGNWVSALTVIDDGKKYGGSAITKAGYAGIRTDFMDVDFDDFSVKSF